MTEEISYHAVFSVDIFWSKIPSSYLDKVTSGFCSPAELSEFCLFLKHSGISRSLDVFSFTEETVDVNIYLIATNICSLAYKDAKAGNFRAAEHAWKMALSIEPDHLASWIGMATLFFNRCDYEQALRWSGMVLQIDQKQGSECTF
jgi:tetratricopeptide (TPR) repeat protein